MTAATMFSFPRANLDLALVSVFATIPLVWIRIIQVGPLAIKPVHIALAGLLISILLSRRLIASVYMYLCSGGRFLLAYLVYLLCLSLSLVWTDSHWIGYGLAQIAKQVVFVGFAVALGAYLISLNKEKLAKTLLVGGLSAYMMFFAAAHLAFSNQGRNVLSYYFTIMKTGDWFAVNYKFFPTIFDGFTYDSTYETLAPMKHDVTNGLFLGFVLFQIGAQTLIRNRKLNGYSQAGLFLISLLMVSILVSTFTRSTLLALVIAMMIVWLARASHVRRRPFTVSRILILIALIVSIAVVGMTVGTTLIAYTLEETGSYQQRLEVYNIAATSIEKNAVLGVGMGHLVGSDAVHNVFLRSWYHAGVLALLAAIVFYVYALGHWLMTIARYIKHPDWWLVPLDAPWVLALPALPLVRTHFTASDFILSQWLCFAVYFALLAANRKRYRTTTSPSPRAEALVQVERAKMRPLRHFGVLRD